MPFGTLFLVDLVRIEVSEEQIASIFKVTGLLNISAKRASCNGISTVVFIRYHGVIDWPLLDECVLIRFSIGGYYVGRKHESTANQQQLHGNG
jgi:hypothetical protein